jgi:hypothetical protein
LGQGAAGTSAVPVKSWFYRGGTHWKEMPNDFSTKGMIAFRCGKPTYLVNPNTIYMMAATP